jgi:SAM-dependent methyltransferase
MNAQQLRWDAPGVVEGFVRSPANQMLLHYAGRLRRGVRPPRVLDIGCGAGRNALPLANAGFQVLGTDLSWPMLQAAGSRPRRGQLQLAAAPMESLPVRARSIDLIVAHGVWNLARSDAEFRAAVRDAARAAVRDARLFVFTFSRSTIPADAQPVPGQHFTFTQFSGEPQIFLTAGQLRQELGDAGFIPDPDLPLRELNLPPPGRVRIGGPPIIFEGGFRFHGA